MEADLLAQHLKDLELPMTSVTRIMRDVLPMDAKIDDDVTEKVQELLSHFIHRITKRANEYCQLEQRKVLQADHLIWAMNQIGMTNYAHLLDRYLERYRHDQNAMGKNNGPLNDQEISIMPPTASPLIWLGNAEPIPGYPYSYFSPNILFYDPATAALLNSRNVEMEAKDNGPADSSSSTVDPYRWFRQ